MNTAYAALMKILPPGVGARLRQSQRAWMAYRNNEQAAQGALFGTRQGTMYVPMQADAAATLTRDRALLLESYLRIMAID